MKYIYLIAGILILTIVVVTIDLVEAFVIAKSVGFGFFVILLVYLIEFIADVMSWQLTFESIPPRAKWTYRLWRIKMIGEALNLSLPAGHFGGEPVKAILLNKRNNIGYSEAIASLVLARTVITISLVIFLVLGFIAAVGAPQISHAERVAASVGLGGFIVAIGLFFLVQRMRLTSGIASFLLTEKLKKKFEAALDHLNVFEDRLIAFYTRRPLAFVLSLLCGLTNWVVGAGTIWFTFYFLGHPITFIEAWIVEAFAQMVRASTFFVPASIGAQDGAFVLVTTAVTGNPALGLAVAMVRRGREIVWIVWGLLIGWRMEALHLTRRHAATPDPG